MKLKTLACLAVTSAMLILPAELSAHGGTYRGPGDTVPPGTGGGGGKTGNPGSPTTPSPGSPSTPSPGSPASPGTGGAPTGPTAPTGGGSTRGGATTGRGGMVLSSDLTQWQFWWEFNKDPYLQLKKAIRSGGVSSGSDDFLIGRGHKKDARNTLAPSSNDRKRIIEALKKALTDKDSNRDIVSSCMMGLAKIGGDPSTLLELKKFLADSDQEKRETAALAMGIMALKEAVPDLIALATSSKEGRALAKREGEVDFRSRAFACYGLGLIAHNNKDMELQSRLFATMKVLSTDKKSGRDIKVAALNAIRLLRPNGTEDGQLLRKNIVDFLSGYMVNKEAPLIRSHAITALAAMVGREGDSKGILRMQLVDMLKSRKFKTWMHQSAVLALGQMATPEDTESIEALKWYMKAGKDIQAKNFCSIALGQIGGRMARNILLSKITSRSTKKITKPWLALGLAIRDHNWRQEDSNHDMDRTAAEGIFSNLKKEKNRLYAAGFAIALGIMKYQDAGDFILEKTIAWKNDSEPAGYLAVALGLLNYQDAKDDINTIVDGAIRRPELLTQGSIALGLLGDKEISLKLIKRLENTKNPVAVHSAVASALGFIGDRRSIEPLITLLENKRSMKDLSRAFSAVALGLVGDKEELPWNSKIAVNANYRANVETLTGGSTGILDIL